MPNPTSVIPLPSSEMSRACEYDDNNGVSYNHLHLHVGNLVGTHSSALNKISASNRENPILSASHLKADGQMPTDPKCSMSLISQ